MGDGTAGILSDMEGLSLHTLNRMLKENRRLQAVNENESPWQGQSVASKVNYALNKGKRRRELEAEEAALVAAIEKTEKAIADRAKAEAEKAKAEAEAALAEAKRLQEQARAAAGTEVKAEEAAAAGEENE